MVVVVVLVVVVMASRPRGGRACLEKAAVPRVWEGAWRPPLSWKPSSRKVKITPKPTVEPHTTPPRSPLRGPPLPRHSPLWACATPCLACFRDTHPGSGTIASPAAPPLYLYFVNTAPEARFRARPRARRGWHRFGSSGALTLGLGSPGPLDIWFLAAGGQCADRDKRARLPEEA